MNDTNTPTPTPEPETAARAVGHHTEQAISSFVVIFVAIILLLVFVLVCVARRWKLVANLVLQPMLLLACHTILLAFQLNDKATVTFYSLTLLPFAITMWLLVSTLFMASATMTTNDDGSGAVAAADVATPLNDDDDADNDAANTQTANTRMFKLKAEDAYMDFGMHTLRALTLGLAQIIMILYYVDGIYQKTTELHDEITYAESCDYERSYYVSCVKASEYNYYYWTGVALIFGYVVGNDFWGSAWACFAFWKDVWELETTAHRQGKVLSWSPESTLAKEPDWVRRVEIFIRGFCSAIINTAGLIFIVLALPFQVAVGAPDDPEVVPLDFILNVVAAFFIIEIDNLSSPVTFTVRLEDPAPPPIDKNENIIVEVGDDNSTSTTNNKPESDHRVQQPKTKAQVFERFAV